MKKPIVSIVIPCYNDAEYVEQAVQSALDQSYSKKEIIVVDDGSNIETKIVLEKIEPSLTALITQENQGQSSARNKGIEIARGYYILMLDSDDFLEPSFCEKAVEMIQSNGEVKIVTCYAKQMTHSHYQIFKPRGGYIEDFLAENSALGTSLFYRKDAIRIGGYDENMKSGFEDWEFFLRLLKDGGHASVIREPLYNYRIRKGSTNYRANQEKYKIRRYIYLKHKQLYIKNFVLFVDFLSDLLEREEKEKLKNLTRIEYQIGYNLLKPLRFIKRKLKLKI